MWPKYLLLGLLLTLLSAGIPVNAAEELNPLQQIDTKLDKADKIFKDHADDISRLDTLILDVERLRQQTQSCIEEQEKQQQQTQAAIESLGEAQTGENTDVTRKRRDLNKDKKSIDTTLSRCRLLDLRANTLLDGAKKTRQERQAQQLFARSASLLDHLQQFLLQAGLWKAELDLVVNTMLNMPFNWQNLHMALAYGLGGLVAGLLWSSYKRRQYRHQKTVFYDTSPTLEIIWRSLLRATPIIVFTALSALSLHYNPAGVPLVSFLLKVILVFSLSYAVLRPLLRTTTRVEGIIPSTRHKNNRMHHWASVLFFTTIVGLFFDSPLLDQPAVDNTDTNHLVSLIRIGCGTLVGFAFIKLLWPMSEHLLFIRRLRLHILTAVTALTAIGSFWLGYRNFAIFLLTGIYSTLFLTLAAWLLIRIPAEIFDGMDHGRAQWQRQLRQHLGLKEEQFVPGLIWVRLVNVSVVLTIGLLLLLRQWGMPEQDLSLLLNKLENGIQIGDLSLEPLRIINGLLVAALLINLTHIFKQHLSENWLQRTRLSRSAREATTTVSGYIGIFLAILAGLAVAGIQLANIALIAGALSVGIGFGLQHIVSNFFSGLILLFERPIRRGDWIKVGEVQGHVKEISIRATTIQTFDREDVIIPNSEFISGQVTNMELSDPHGRIIIPVGVAYGSNTEVVIQLLKQIAEQHPETLYEDGEAQIMALFRNFGDSALNFELYCHIKDVSKKLSVTSELNLAIDKAFREHAIEIPFPQRTLHMATPPVKMPDPPVKPKNLS